MRVAVQVNMHKQTHHSLANLIRSLIDRRTKAAAVAIITDDWRAYIAAQELERQRFEAETLALANNK